MRYNVSFNQFEVVKYNLGKIKKDQLDITDAIILQQLYWLSEWANVETINLKDGRYFWIAYSKLLSELPVLGIQTRNGLAKRINKKLLKPGLLRLHIQRNDNSKTYWKLTDRGLIIAAPGQKAEGTMTNGRMTPGGTNQSHSDQRANNNITNDNKTIDKREQISHFEFLKINNSKELNKWLGENWNKVFNKDLLLESFNDAMSEKDKKKDHKLIFSFKRYARHWIRNQKESERPPIIPPYLRKCSA